jgi:ATP-dependent Clp protease adaptor protein ClpS
LPPPLQTSLAAKAVSSAILSRKGRGMIRRLTPLAPLPPLSYFRKMTIQNPLRTTAGPDRDDDDQGGGNNGRPGVGPGVGLATRTRPKTKKPSHYKVLLLNDDYTPMEFVVHVLKAFFSMDTDQATRVMLHVHQKGVGVCGIFTYEVAETKVTQVMDFAKKNQHPLQCTLEKA